MEPIPGINEASKSLIDYGIVGVLLFFAVIGIAWLMRFIVLKLFKQQQAMTKELITANKLQADSNATLREMAKDMHSVKDDMHDIKEDLNDLQRRVNTHDVVLGRHDEQLRKIAP